MSALVPWEVRPQHRWAYPLQMLRLQEKVAAGEEIRPSMAARLTHWLAEREADDTVVAYDPDSEEGFSYVPRPASNVVPFRRPD